MQRLEKGARVAREHAAPARGVVELTAVIGYYTMVAQTLNAHQLPLPEGATGLPPATILVTLPPGRHGSAS